MNPCSMVSCDTLLLTTVPNDTLAGLVLTTESKRTITVSMRTATKSISQRQMYRCMRITIEKTRLSSKKVFRDFERLKRAQQSTVHLLANELLTSTAEELVVNLPSKTKQTWVSQLEDTFHHTFFLTNVVLAEKIIVAFRFQTNINLTTSKTNSYRATGLRNL